MSQEIQAAAETRCFGFRGAGDCVNHTRIVVVRPTYTVRSFDVKIWGANVSGVSARDRIAAVIILARPARPRGAKAAGTRPRTSWFEPTPAAMVCGRVTVR